MIRKFIARLMPLRQGNPRRANANCEAGEVHNIKFWHRLRPNFFSISDILLVKASRKWALPIHQFAEESTSCPRNSSARTASRMTILNAQAHGIQDTVHEG